MDTKLPKNISFYCIIFSLVFLPLKLKLGNFFSTSQYLLQQSDVLISEELVAAKGFNISVPLCDVAILTILITLFKYSKKLKKNEFIVLTFIYSSIILGSINNFLGNDQILIINIYNLRFIFYTLIFLFKSDIIEKFLPLLKEKITYTIPLFFLFYSSIEIFTSINLPNIYGSRLEIFPPLLIFGFLSFYYHKLNKIKRPFIVNTFLFLLLLNYSFCGKRGLLIPIFFIILFYFFNEIRTKRLKLKFNLNYINIFSFLIIVLSFIYLLTNTIKSVPSVDTLDYYYLEKVFSNDYLMYLDGSTQERLGKIIKTIYLYVENPIKIILPSGINAFKLINDFIPDSLLESFFNLGLIQTIFIIYIAANIKRIKLWCNLKSESSEIISCFLPLILIIGYGFTCNIIAINYIYPAFAFYNSLIDSQLKKEIS